MRRGTRRIDPVGQLDQPHMSMRAAFFPVLMNSFINVVEFEFLVIVSKVRAHTGVQLSGNVMALD